MKNEPKAIHLVDHHGPQNHPRSRVTRVTYLAVLNGDEGDVALLAEGGDELLVSRLIASVGEDAKVGLVTVEGLDSLVETTAETLVEEGVAEDNLEGGLHSEDLLNLSGGGVSDDGGTTEYKKSDKGRIYREKTDEQMDEEQRREQTEKGLLQRLGRA